MGGGEEGQRGKRGREGGALQSRWQGRERWVGSTASVSYGFLGGWWETARASMETARTLRTQCVKFLETAVLGWLGRWLDTCPAFFLVASQWLPPQQNTRQARAMCIDSKQIEQGTKCYIQSWGQKAFHIPQIINTNGSVGLDLLEDLSCRGAILASVRSIQCQCNAGKCSLGFVLCTLGCSVLMKWKWEFGERGRRDQSLASQVLELLSAGPTNTPNNGP